MFKSIRVINYKNEELYIDFFSSENSGFNIRSIDGLGPVKANINTTKNVLYDGDIYNNARADKRNIVIELGFVITPEIGLKTIEDCRLKAYKYFPLKKRLRFIVETDNRTLYADGYVESNEPNIFSEDETTRISIVCPSSWLNSYNENEIEMSNLQGRFEFPFEVLESDVEPYDISNQEDPRHLPIIKEQGSTDNFYGNFVFELYKTNRLYGSLESFKYEDLVNGFTYNNLKVV